MQLKSYISLACNANTVADEMRTSEGIIVRIHNRGRNEEPFASDKSITYVLGYCF
jgi:hypothetical protein